MYWLIVGVVMGILFIILRKNGQPINTKLSVL